MHSSFRISEEASPELIQFLSNTILGTNGAQYQHLDTATRIQEMENPLHLSLIRNGKILANISFARREKNWYVRYFAFDKAFQGSGKYHNEKDKNSFFKKEMREFFSSKIESGEVDCFYAYIDPLNDRSHAAASALGFTKKGDLFTQTFSRLHPKPSHRFSKIQDKTERDDFIMKTFKDEAFFHKPKQYASVYCLKNSDGAILAFANATPLQWIIHRLPGRFGKTAARLLHFIPILSAFIRPKHHKFVGVDHVWAKDDNSELVEELFSAILAAENRKMIMWWTDKRVLNFGESIRWGVMHALLKNNPVNLFSIDKLLNYNKFDLFTNVKDFS